MKKKYLLIFVLFIAFSLNNTTKAQTSLVAGDIAVLWSQTDTPDKFAFVPFVDLAAGTAIYFSDCGVVTGGTINPAGCTEGAVKYTVPAGGITKGTIVTWVDGATDFSNYTDTLISGSIALSTSGDQVLVFQDAANPGGSANASANPKFIFIMNTASTLFTGNAASSSTETSLPTGLSDTGLPRTALGVGSGTGVSDEYDNVVYKGTYTFATVALAKTAITNPINYFGSDTNPPGDATYNGYVTAMPSMLTFTTLSTIDVNFENDFNVFPNPSNGNLTIKNPGIALYFATILDANSRIIDKLDLKGTTKDVKLNLEGKLTSGLYFIEIQSEKGIMVKKLIIK